MDLNGDSVLPISGDGGTVSGSVTRNGSTDDAASALFPTAWGQPPTSHLNPPSAAFQVPRVWQDSSVAESRLVDAEPASVVRDFYSGIIDFATVLLLSALVLAALTPFRLILGLMSTARNVSRRDAIGSAIADQDLGDLAIQILGLQAALIVVSLWIVAVPLAFVYTTLGTTIFGATFGRIATRTRLRSHEGETLRGVGIARSGLAVAAMWLMPPLVCANGIVFFATLGRKRLRLGQRMAGAYAVSMQNNRG